jgi:deoxycytidylate deaminase
MRDLKGINDDAQINRLIAKDDKENNPLGQQTRNVFELSDAFVTTDGEDSLERQLTRVAELLFSKPTVPPTAQEYAMFMAYAASLRSADLARQVGAVIVNDHGDIISTGANDVPAYGGGLYWPGPADQRDYINGTDSNEIEKVKIAEDVVKRILGESTSATELTDAMVRLHGSKLMNITEYGRAVHAEMEALLAAARNGASVRGGVLYTTTYPCHNCAKHIVAAGIKDVVFIEPYPKSYATTLHSDAISNDGKDLDRKVQFRQFVGIGPRRFIDLFSMRLSSGRTVVRKQNGKVLDWSRNSAELRVPMTPLSYLDAEVALVTELSDALEEVNNG